MVDENKNLYPTSLIPFCAFGGNESAMGIKIPQVEVPVCNSFKAKIFNDQLCYTVDPNEYKKKLAKQDDLSLELILNYNEDREVWFSEKDDVHHIGKFLYCQLKL